MWKALKCGAGGDKVIRKVTNEEFIERTRRGEKRTLIKNIFLRKVGWIREEEIVFSVMTMEKRWRKYKEYEQEERSSFLISETEDCIGN